MKRGADVEYLPLICFQLREGCAANVECAFEIDIDDRAKTVRRELFSGAQKVTGRAIHDDVDFAEVGKKEKKERS